ncbi:MAG: hypothetical protein HYX75_16710 [Acidobacteria bacterium]|nr:hypothetical protein [Acidobacteriota bacterium]
MRRGFSLVGFSINHPRLVIVLAGIVTLAFATQFAKLTTDTNPKNMLPETSDVRVWNDQIEKIFGLYEDMIVIGVSNVAGVLNPRTLGKIKRITDELMQIKGIAGRDVSSFPTITNVTADAGLRRDVVAKAGRCRPTCLMGCGLRVNTNTRIIGPDEGGALPRYGSRRLGGLSRVGTSPRGIRVVHGAGWT